MLKRSSQAIARDVDAMSITASDFSIYMSNVPPSLGADLTPSASAAEKARVKDAYQDLLRAVCTRSRAKRDQPRW